MVHLVLEGITCDYVKLVSRPNTGPAIRQSRRESGTGRWLWCAESSTTTAGGGQFASLLDRPLPDEHFDFRHGDPPRRKSELGALTRCNDPSPVQQAESPS